jgi:PAS domain S-box-containing protein
MNAFGMLNLIVAALELCVPSYAFHLVRRFGARQVGGFVIIAFISLALLHVVNPLKPGFGANQSLSLIYGAASVLLLIGMGHTETVCRERRQAQNEEEKLRHKLDAELQEKAENLLQVNQQMAQEIARFQQQVESLSAAERHYRFLFTQHPRPLWVYDLRTGRILAGNEAALELYGFGQQEFTALSAKDLMADDATEAFLADSAKPCSSSETRGIWRHKRKDRSTVEVEVTAMDFRFGQTPSRLMLAEDIAPRLNRESQLSEEQRARILRRVAGGVAHHFGRILGVIEEHSTLLRGSEEQASAGERADQILAETRRGGVLIRQLLGVASCETMQAEPIELNEFVRKKEGLLRRLTPEQIQLEFHLEDNLPAVLSDARVLEHMLLNLVLNARDALPQGGSINIYTEPAWVDAAPAQQQPNTVPGQYIQLTVRDNGCGMTPEVQRHLFEPFFTTRKHQNAMGLGLATIHGALAQLGGWVEFVTQPNQGTEVRAYLPVGQIVTKHNALQQSWPEPASRETIMLVESHDSSRDLMRRVLELHGYRVIETDSPATVSLLMEGSVEHVHLLLTNLTFAGNTSGRDLADQLQQRNPNLKVVYTGEPLPADDSQTGPSLQGVLLTKPYTPDQLMQTINCSLGKPALPQS